MNSQLALQLESKMKQGFQYHVSGELEEAQILYKDELVKENGVSYVKSAIELA